MIKFVYDVSTVIIGCTLVQVATPYVNDYINRKWPPSSGGSGTYLNNYIIG